MQNQRQEPSKAELIEAVRIHRSGRKAAAALQMSETTFRRRLNAPDTATSLIEIPELPDDDMSVEELIEHRTKEFARKKAYREATKLIPVKVKTKGPIGILHFGDPHLDDPGTDIASIQRDIRLVQETEGLYGANLGDLTNNWVGRLARLYGQQSTTAKQGWKLADWFVGSIDWIYFIYGNHCLWNQGDEIISRMQTYGPSMPPMMAARVGLNFPNGRQIRVNARHNFRGNSQWNAAHGVMKAAQMGEDDHLFVCGDRHISGYGVVKSPDSGIISHCLQVASYKIYDRYADENGFRDQHVSPSVLTVLDPDSKTEVGLVQTFFDTEQGADFLKYKRRKV